jgi:hypothetical protein
MTLGLAPPKNITNLFGNWLKGIQKKDLVQIRVGVCAGIWKMWNTRNDFILKNISSRRRIINMRGGRVAGTST